MRLPRRWRRPSAAASAAVLGVLLVSLLAWAVVPHRAAATAVLTVTPRTEAGADASRLLTDRYLWRARAGDTLAAAAADLPPDDATDAAELAAATTVRRPGDGSVIEVTVSLADRGAAARAANAVVAQLVEQGADEELVDVRSAAPAVAGAAVGTPPAGTWWTGTALVALLLGATAAWLADRRGSATPASIAGRQVEPQPARLVAAPVDDLPGFRDRPPGSPGLPTPDPKPSMLPALRTGGSPDSAPTTDSASTARVLVALSTAALVLIGVAVGVAAFTDDDPSAAPAPPTGSDPATSTTPTPTPTSSTPISAQPSAPPSTVAAAGMAMTSLPLGADGRAARLEFTGVLLEQRSVGVTVAYPVLSLTTDGRQSLVHVALPTWNCLLSEPPADPVSAGCTRTTTQFADAGSMPGSAGEATVLVTADGLDVTATLATYTRPSGSPPAYTGATYRLTARVEPSSGAAATPTGPVPASGRLQLGSGSADSTDTPGNQLRYPD